MKAFLVARVSTLDQADALPGQIYKLETYAKSKGFEYELFEIKESAYSAKRTDFSKIIETVVSYPEPCIVVFDKIDRYTRNSNSNEVTILNSLCRAGKIEMHFPSDNLFINKTSSAQEHFMLNVGVSTAQYYSDSIRDNVNRRKEQKLRDGEIVTKAPFGYRNIRDSANRSDVVVEPFESEVVKVIFSQYASGIKSLRTIRDHITSKYSLRLSVSKIESILKNPFYHGEMIVGGKTYPHKYEKLINKDTYELALKVRNGHNVRPTRWAGLPYRYRGLVVCAACGCRITFERKKKKYTYGHCTQAKGKHHAHYVAEARFDEQIATALAAIRIPEKAYELISSALNSDYLDRVKDSELRLSALDAKISQGESKLERLYDDYLEGLIDRQFYEKKVEELIGKLGKLRDSRQSFELIDKQRFISQSHLLDVARRIPELFQQGSNDHKRSLINMILSNLELFEDQLRWKYKKPFDTMALSNKNLDWQG